MHLRRLLVFVALLGAMVVFVFELPIRELSHQRDALASVSAELNKLQAQNHELASTIASLRQNSVVSAIAHADYGLIFSGQHSFVVLPGKQSVSGAANTLSEKPIPDSDLVPDESSSVTSGQSTPAKKTSGLLSRTVTKLEFWRWAF